MYVNLFTVHWNNLDIFLESSLMKGNMGLRMHAPIKKVEQGK